MDSKKLVFLQFVVENITENPEWLPDLTLALNQGLSEALKNEYRKVSDLASSFGWLTTATPLAAKTAIKEIHYIERGLRRLRDFYAGAPIQKTIDEILEHYKEE